MTSSEVPAVKLPAGDAEELAELLEFLDDWLRSNYRPASRALNTFTGYGYDIADLRGDLARFIFLLGGPADRFINGSER